MHGQPHIKFKAVLFTALRSRNDPITSTAQENISPVISQFFGGNLIHSMKIHTEICALEVSAR